MFVIKKVKELLLNSVQTKIMVSIALIFIMTIFVIIGYSKFVIEDIEIKRTELSALKEAKKQALAIDRLLAKATEKGQTIASMLAAQISNKERISIERSYVIEMLRNQIDGQDEFVGIGTAWEPNAFDGRDSEFSDAFAHDSSGRFIPYVYKNSSGIQIEALQGYENENMIEGTDFRIGEWYLTPKKTKNITIVGPYPYILGNKTVLMTTISTPIIVNNHFYGIVAVDFTIDYIQNFMNKLDLFENKAEMLAITFTGDILGYTNHKELIGKKISSHAGFEQTWVSFQSLLKNNKEVIVIENNRARILEPITLEPLGAVGAVIIDIEESLLTENADKASWAETILGLSGVIIGLIIVYFLIQAIMRPLEKTSSIIKKIERTSDFSIRADINSEDEVGMIAKSVNGLLDSIQGSFNELIEVMGAVSNGDLSKRLSSDKGGDLKSLNSKTNNSLDILSKSFKLVHNSTSKVDKGIESIKSSTTLLASNNAEQAAAIEEISSTIIEISNQTKANTENVNEAQKLVSSTINALAEGNSQMNDMSASMDRISNMSTEIGKIIKNIDDIAFQTNLLALNAAVESARAGTHGKGFAVVAEEVRSLATRCVEAAKNTGTMIEKTISEVNIGVENTKQTEGHIQKITSTINEFTLIMKSIQENSNIQSNGITQINEGIQQVNGALQEIAATSEKSSTTSQLLANESNQMKQVVARFKI